MIQRNLLLLLATLFFLPLTSAHPSAPGLVEAKGAHPTNEPTPVIFDTDMWSDIDDMLALAMLHALQDRHEVNLLAVTVSTEDPWSASYVDLVNTFYGHAGIPVGLVRDGMNLQKFRERYPRLKWPVTRYTEIISQRKASDGTLLYPHRLTDGGVASDAVSLLRRTLATQRDGSVVMIQVGYSTNLARLLDSKADSISSLDGRDLVATKVRLLSVMGGDFHDAEADGRMVAKGSPEFNLAVDVPAAQKVFSSWPTPMVDSGFEIGIAMRLPGQSISHDYSYVENHPIADSYRTFCSERMASDSTIRHCPEDHDHPTFDLTAVLYAARPNQHYFSMSKPGRITVLDDGGSRFDESPEGKQRYLILDDAQKARALEAMIMLASQPPTHYEIP